MNTVFTGLSDFHKLALSDFKPTFSKSEPKVITVRNFKNFSEENFNQELRTNLGKRCVKNNTSFENVFLDKHVPFKKKVVRANHVFVTKSLRKAIMKRSDLQKIYF